MQRSIAIVLVALALVPALAGCGKKDSEPAKEAPPPGGPPAQPKPAEPAAPPVAPVTAADYDAHMRRGDELAKQRKWSEALAELELAAAARPNDARALGYVGFAAYFAGNTARAREASEAAVIAAGSDPDLKGSALFNLGLALERTAPRAAASLYAASIAVRPNTKVRARLAKVLRDQPSAVRESSPDGDALMAKLSVKPLELPPVQRMPSKLDRAMLDVFDAANVEWDGGMGKMMAGLENVVCTEVTSPTPRYACTHPALDGKVAQMLVENLVARRIAGEQRADRTVYSVASITCTSPHVELDDGRIPAASCEVRK
jgi:tetratricopeptide (TPR) repeat protein